MRILFITQWFEPEPAFKGLDFAKALRDAGHEVQVLTGFPNYPAGRLYPGYRIRPVQREKCDGIPVVRVALYPNHDLSAARRILNYLSFALSAATFGLLNVDDVDVTYVYSSPATAAIPALVLRALRGTPFVIDILDLWPDSVAATGMLTNRIALKVLAGACHLVYRASSRISVVSEGFKRRLEESGISTERTTVIYNWAVEEEEIWAGKPWEPEGWPGGQGLFRVLFAGNMGRAQGLGAVIHAARILRHRLPEVRFVFMGDGVEAQALKESASGLENVVFLKREPRDRAARCLLKADALLVHLEDAPLFEITIPSKIQTYLAAGRPIIVGVRGDAAELVLQAGAGVACRPGDPGSIAGAVEALASMSAAERESLGERGRTFYRERLSKQMGIDATLRLLETAVA
jgi:colanic acid biosynthesis glycosyl transferase WcaI